MPTDEQYLPSFNIVGIFRNLSALNDAQVTDSLRALIRALRNQEVKSKSEHVKTLMKSLADIESDMKLEDN